MENQIVNTPNTQSPNPAPIVPKSNMFPMMLAILISAVIFGFGGYYFGMQSVKPQPITVSTEVTPTPTMMIQNSIPSTPLATSTPLIQRIVTLPTGWSYTSNNECTVKFALPPKSAPYMGSDSRFWDFPRGAASPNLLTKVANNREYKQAITMYVTTGEASGYIAQAVAVSCIPNNGLYKDNTQLMTALSSELKKYNASTGEKGMQPSTYTIKSTTPVIRWNQQVLDLVVGEDTTNVSYTLFVTPQYVYEVKIFGALEDKFVKDTAKQIFDLLTF